MAIGLLGLRGEGRGPAAAGPAGTPPPPHLAPHHSPSPPFLLPPPPQVTDESSSSALVRCIKSDPNYVAGKARLLIFVKDGDSADRASATLDAAGIRNVVYHSGIPAQDRALALQVMQQQPLAVMVCTDMAARGLDLASLTHVVQLDFASNAIDFIHRIGRTGRAGGPGKVTSLYREHNLTLVQVLRQYLEDGEPLEAAFSRSRSFTRKIKRRGEFVPRGMSLEEHHEQQQRRQPQPL